MSARYGVAALFFALLHFVLSQVGTPMPAALRKEKPGKAICSQGISGYLEQSVLDDLGAGGLPCIRNISEERKEHG